MRKFVMPFAVLALIAGGAIAGTKTVDGVEVRDWKAVDTNADHLVSADEMENHLRQQWATKQQSASSDKQTGNKAAEKPQG